MLVIASYVALLAIFLLDLVPSSAFVVEVHIPLGFASGSASVDYEILRYDPHGLASVEAAVRQFCREMGVYDIESYRDILRVVKEVLEQDALVSHEVIEKKAVGGAGTPTGSAAPESVVVSIRREQELLPAMTDKGWHPYGAGWWTNNSCPFRFKYFRLDGSYTPDYFDSDSHPSPRIAEDLYGYMQGTFSGLFGRRFGSILELGVGGGEITGVFRTHALDYHAVEGTSGGVSKLLGSGVPSSRVTQSDLRFLQPIGRRFDLVMCTEVAEHIEPWFASKVVQNCVDHADVVWFSAARPFGVYQHYHHINEVPIEAWDNLFALFGYNHYVALNGTSGRADRLYMSAIARDRLFGTDAPSAEATAV